MCCAQNNGKLELARLLVMRGANFSVKNALGDSPIDLAKRYSHHEILMLFNNVASSQGAGAEGGYLSS